MCSNTPLGDSSSKNPGSICYGCVTPHDHDESVSAIERCPCVSLKVCSDDEEIYVGVRHYAGEYDAPLE